MREAAAEQIDTWGEEPRQSVETMETTETLETLYPDATPDEGAEPEGPEQAEQSEQSEQPAQAAEPSQTQQTPQDDPYKAGVEDAQTEAQLQAVGNQLVQDVVGLGAKLGLDAQAAAKYVQSGRVNEVLSTIQQQGQRITAELEKTDKGKAVALRGEIAEAVKTLQQQYGELSQIASAHQESKVTRKLSSEQARLPKDFDGKAARAYAESYGFTPEEIASVQDHRLATIIDKARRFDQQQKGQSKRIPKRARKPKARAAPKQDGRKNMFGAPWVESPGVQLGREMYPSPKPKPPRRTNSDDPVAILYPNG